MIYLAIPYTWNPEKSFHVANKVAAELMLKGNVVFSPISHSHPIMKSMEKDPGHEFWMTQDLEMLAICHKIVVVVIGNCGMNLIQESEGIQQELTIARKKGISMSFYHYDL